MGYGNEYNAKTPKFSQSGSALWLLGTNITLFPGYPKGTRNKEYLSTHPDY